MTPEQRIAELKERLAELEAEIRKLIAERELQRSLAELLDPKTPGEENL
jgi:hypothetical protein